MSLAKTMVALFFSNAWVDYTRKEANEEAHCLAMATLYIANSHVFDVIPKSY